MVFTFVWKRLADQNLSKLPVVESEIWTFFLFQAGHVFHKALRDEALKFGSTLSTDVLFFIWPFISCWSVGLKIDKLAACPHTRMKSSKRPIALRRSSLHCLLTKNVAPTLAKLMENLDCNLHDHFEGQVHHSFGNLKSQASDPRHVVKWKDKQSILIIKNLGLTKGSRSDLPSFRF